MSGKSSGKKKDSGWLQKTTANVANPDMVKTTVVNKDGTYDQSALMGDFKVNVERVKYPVYYLVRHKNEKDAEPVAMICVKNTEEDVGYPTSVAIFIRKNFKITRISKEEAETYDAIEVAPLFNPVEFAKWISVINEDLGRTFSEVGIQQRDGKVQKGKHTYDLNPTLHQKDLES